SDLPLVGGAPQPGYPAQPIAPQWGGGYPQAAGPGGYPQAAGPAGPGPQYPAPQAMGPAGHDPRRAPVPPPSDPGSAVRSAVRQAAAQPNRPATGFGELDLDFGEASAPEAPRPTAQVPQPTTPRVARPM